MRILSGGLVAVSQLSTNVVAAVSRQIDLAMGTGRAAMMVNRITHIWGMDGAPAIDLFAEGIGSVGRDPDDPSPGAMGFDPTAADAQSINADLISVSSAIIVDTGAIGQGQSITVVNEVDDYSYLDPEHRPVLVRNVAHVLQLRGSTTLLRHSVVIRYQVVELSEAELVQALAFRR